MDLSGRAGAVAGAVLALVLLLVGAWSIGGERVDAYAADSAKWLAEDRTAVLDAVATQVPEGYGETEASCEQLDHALATINDAGASIPKVESGTLSILRPGLDDAADESIRRSETAGQFLDRARAAYEQMAIDCRWSVEYRAAGGHEDQVLPLWADDACTATSYGDSCDELGSAWDDVLEAGSRRARAVQRKASGADVRTILLEQWPDLEPDAMFRKDPLSPTVFFGAVAGQMLAELDDARAGFENLD